MYTVQYPAFAARGLQCTSREPEAEKETKNTRARLKCEPKMWSETLPSFCNNSLDSVQILIRNRSTCLQYIMIQWNLESGIKFCLDRSQCSWCNDRHSLLIDIAGSCPPREHVAHKLKDDRPGKLRKTSAPRQWGAHSFLENFQKFKLSYIDLIVSV
jgi:hypothetical protein